MEKKIKVVWICSVSNSKLRSQLELGLPLWNIIARKLMNRRTTYEVPDSAQWNTNALREFEGIDDVDLHVIFVHPKMRYEVQRFSEGGIKYYAVNSNDTSFSAVFWARFNQNRMSYEKIWKRIVVLVEEIKPDIIHIMGAENPEYSLSINYLPSNVPIITQLQTLLNDSSIEDYSTPKYRRQRECELKVLLRTNYIGTNSSNFPRIIRESIRKDVCVVKTRLLIAEKPDLSEHEKHFDYVYFANFINKSVDLAIEGFAIACKKRPEIKMDIIGGVDDKEKKEIENRLEELGIRSNVVIEGKLPTHDNVLAQIKKSRIALLPLKTDMVSGTIRESIWCGLPVVSTITHGTPVLNEHRESVLLSKIGDHNALANNMLLLLDNKELSDRLKRNAIITVEERYGNNRQRALKWVEAYHACIKHFFYNTPIPDHILNQN